MQVIKPEWARLQAQFMPLPLNEQLMSIIAELQTLKREIAAQPNELLEESPLHPNLRKIQHYIEWAVPAFLPERAENAEVLVNVNRFAARLLMQTEPWNSGKISAELEQQISAIQNLCTVPTQP
jgi:hypothetical protein